MNLLHDPRRWAALTLVAALLLPGFALAKKKKNAPASSESPAAAPLPLAADLFAANVVAMGGEAAIRAHRNQRGSGTAVIPMQGIEASVEVHAEAPDHMAMVMNLPGIGAMESGYDGTIGWSNDPMSGPSLMEGAQLVDTRRDADFYADLTYPERYDQMKTEGRVQWGPYRAYKVRGVTPEGKEEIVYFDQDTGLRVGSETMTETDMGPMPIRITCDGFQDFSGVRLATRCIEASGPIEVIVTFTSMEDDAHDFALPPLPEAVQALVADQPPAAE